MNKRQESFCYHYAACGNGVEAAIKAGYSKRSAKQRAHILLTKDDLKQKVQEIRNESLEELKIESKDIIRELTSVAFSSMDSIVGIDKNGKAFLRPNAKLIGVSNISYTKSENGESFSIKISDKFNALRELAKIIGAYDQNEKKESNSIGRILESIRKLGE